jgi:hypothetical protein
MSDPNEKAKNATRRHRDEVAVKRQVRIAKTNHVPVDEPHKLAKKHAMNCGNPGCMLCSNPRKTFKELTIQEQSFYQDTDDVRDRHSNGLPPKDE